MTFDCRISRRPKFEDPKPPRKEPGNEKFMEEVKEEVEGKPVNRITRKWRR